MKEFKEALKCMCSDEHGKFQITEVIAGVGIALLKRVSEVRILFGTPPQNTAILTSCGVFLLLVQLVLLPIFADICRYWCCT